MTTPPTGSLRYPGLLLAAFIVVFIALGVAPAFRQDWALENVVALALTATLVFTVRRLRFSNVAYTCIFVFLVLHETGAHYTYSLVPYDDWWRQLAGVSLNEQFGWQRNHYDRLLHFLYGLLMMPAALELFAAQAPGRGLWRWLPALAFLASHAVIYELIEWAAVAVFGGELGAAYLGTQGDVWDAQKDMALALAGSVIGLGLMLGVERSVPTDEPSLQ
jgi:putative membrane protein